MSRASILARGRRAAETGMVDACTITRPIKGDQRGELNTTTFKYDSPTAAPTTVYTGACRTQVTALIANSAAPTAGERVLRTQGNEFQVPIDGTDTVAVGDICEITSAPNDPANIGRKFTVIALHTKTDATARRLRVEEATG